MSARRVLQPAQQEARRNPVAPLVTSFSSASDARTGDVEVCPGAMADELPQEERREIDPPEILW